MRQRQRCSRINADDFNIFSTPRKLISSLQYPDALDLDLSDTESPILSRHSIKLRKQFPTMAETMSSSTVIFGEETTPQPQMIMSKKKSKSYAKLIIAISFVAVVLFTSVMMLMENQDDDLGYYTVPT